MSKKYSDWLLISDIDGTLNDKSMKLPANNKKEIKRFVEAGGNFTLCSGRNLESLNIHYNKLGIKTPAICLNGAGIFDYNSNNLIYYNVITTQGEEVLLDIFSRYKLLNLTVFSYNKIFLAKKTCLYGFVISKLDNLSYEFCNKISDLPRGSWGKISFFGLPSTLKKIQKELKNENNSELFDCFYTSPVTLEVVNKGVNKGNAVLKLAEYLGINKKNTAAVGDYYNDVDMFKRVEHPVCCGQAPDDIKEMCEHVTCHCNNGAVAEFINYIENKYIK